MSSKKKSSAIDAITELKKKIIKHPKDCQCILCSEDKMFSRVSDDENLSDINRRSIESDKELLDNIASEVESENKEIEILSKLDKWFIYFVNSLFIITLLKSFAQLFYNANIEITSCNILFSLMLLLIMKLTIK